VDIPDHTDAVVNLPDMRIGRYLWSLVANHSAQQTQLFFHDLCPAELSQSIIQRLSQVKETLSPGHFRLREPFKPTLSSEQYKQSVTAVKNYILSGDCYQTNFTQHFSSSFEGDLWQAYLALREAAPSPYSAFWQWQDKALLSISPERFVKSSEGKVETKPIKGTLLRGKTVEEDQDNAVALLNSAKDRAENLMIVDLLRNDLGKNCVPGSIRVPKLFALESFPNVHHLVSTVSGVLADQRSSIDLLKGCFPGGSITGAPKKRAMEIIEELEPVKRSVYCGSIGYISATGRMDTNIAIRTIVADGSSLHCWGGGGIVADSQADCEYKESINKIKLLLSTLENLN
jgi:para-aminobenzoate synthetase component 1